MEECRAEAVALFREHLSPSHPHPYVDFDTATIVISNADILEVFGVSHF